MAETAKERLAELRASQARDRLNELRNSQVEEPADSGGGGIIDTLGRNIAQPFNEGLLSIPSMLPGGDDLRQTAEYLGMVPGEGEGADGIPARAAEILGGSALPAGAIGALGKQVLTRGIPAVQQTVMQHLAAQSAARPVSSAVGEVVGAAGAGAGGEIAEQNYDSPSAEVMGELIGGTAAALTPGAVVTAAKHSPVGYVAREVGEAAKSLSPTARASGELQGRAVNPAESAARIDPSSPMPPARQAGDPRLLALEESLLNKSDPAEADRVARHVGDTVDQAKRDVTEIGGDPAEARRVIEESGQATIRRATERADEAAKEAEDALSGLDSGADPADISRAAREKVAAAVDAGRAAEREAWGKVDQTMPRNLDETIAAVKSIEGETGVFNRKEAIPDKIRQALEFEGDLVMRDVHGLRQFIQNEIRNELGQTAGANWGRVRQLRKLENGLLKDMSAGDDPALAEAREVSRIFNEKFSRGKMGQVMGERLGVERVPDADTLSNIFGGQFAARDLEQLMAGTPEARGDAIDFVRKQFLLTAVKDGAVNQNQANRFISKLRERRIFEVLPELEADLTAATSKSNRAQTLAERAKIVDERGGARLERGSKESLASMYLDKPVGEEADILLDPKNAQRSEQLARRLMTRLEGNQVAEDGLRRSFMERMMARSTSGRQTAEGEPITSGANFTRLLRENESTIKALGFTDDQIRRMRQTAKVLREAEAKPGGADSGKIMTDPMGRFIDLISAYVGARVGSGINRIVGGKGAGVSLQAAQRGASNLSQLARWMTPDAAEQILIDAIDDPDLFKSLLLRNNSPADVKKEAMQKLNLWAASAGYTGGEDESEE